jgi:hypothetical protein
MNTTLVPLGRATRKLMIRPLFLIPALLIGLFSVTALIAFWIAPDTQWLLPVVSSMVPATCFVYVFLILGIADRRRRRDVVP